MLVAPMSPSADKDVLAPWSNVSFGRSPVKGLVFVTMEAGQADPEAPALGTGNVLLQDCGSTKPERASSRHTRNSRVWIRYRHVCQSQQSDKAASTPRMFDVCLSLFQSPRSATGSRQAPLALFLLLPTLPSAPQHIHRLLTRNLYHCHYYTTAACHCPPNTTTRRPPVAFELLLLIVPSLPTRDKLRRHLPTFQPAPDSNLDPDYDYDRQQHSSSPHHHPHSLQPINFLHTLLWPEHTLQSFDVITIPIARPHQLLQLPPAPRCVISGLCKQGFGRRHIRVAYQQPTICPPFDKPLCLDNWSLLFDETITPSQGNNGTRLRCHHHSSSTHIPLLRLIPSTLTTSPTAYAFHHLTPSHAFTTLLLHHP